MMCSVCIRSGMSLVCHCMVHCLVISVAYGVYNSLMLIRYYNYNNYNKTFH